MNKTNTKSNNISLRDLIDDDIDPVNTDQRIPNHVPGMKFSVDISEMPAGRFAGANVVLELKEFIGDQ